MKGGIHSGAAELREVPHIGETLAEKLAGSLVSVDVDAELAKMDRHGVSALVLGTAEYPSALASIATPPHVLYCRGTLEAGDAKLNRIESRLHEQVEFLRVG